LKHERTCQKAGVGCGMKDEEGPRAILESSPRMPPKKGTSAAASAKGSGGPGHNGSNGGGNGPRVCKPAVQKLPSNFLPTPTKEGIPTVIESSLTEFYNFRPFFTTMERIFPDIATHGAMDTCWFGTRGDELAAFERQEGDNFSCKLTLQNGEDVPVFLKRAHLLDPIDVIEGNCIWPDDGALPAPSELWMNSIQKVTDPFNEAYIDGLFATIASRLVTHKISPHWVRCFGTFPARVEKYMYNITEEYDSLKNKPFWKKGQDLGLFRLEIAEPDSEEVHDADRRPITSDEGEELSMDLVEEVAAPSISGGEVASETVATTLVEGDLEEVDIPAEDEEVVKVNAPRVRLKKLSNPDSEGSSSGDDGDDYNDYYAELTNFPVQVTLLEKAEGTLDELLDAEEGPEAEKEARWKSWLFQIIAALSVAQHYFGFCHNDLHTNNVMWSRTDKPYLYYRVHKGKKSQVMRVPTHGYIMKIIDFGRASFWLPDPAGFFISDAFYPGNDATDQYNCEPFYDPKAGKKVEPNPSFDLCRLTVSLLESLYPKRPENAVPVKIVNREDRKIYAETISPLYNLMWEWLLDDSGKNVLRSPNGEERYPDFDLYKAISTDVHKAVPAVQIEKALFQEYVTAEDVPAGEHAFDLWAR
jgi:hypothetical protein